MSSHPNRSGRAVPVLRISVAAGVVVGLFCVVHAAEVCKCVAPAQQGEVDFTFKRPKTDNAQPCSKPVGGSSTITVGGTFPTSQASSINVTGTITTTGGETYQTITCRTEQEVGQDVYPRYKATELCTGYKGVTVKWTYYNYTANLGSACFVPWGSNNLECHQAQNNGGSGVVHDVEGYESATSACTWQPAS